MAYVEELRANYREAHKRLWSGRFPSDEPRIKPVEKPMEYSGKASGDLWWGINPKCLEGATVRGRDIIRAVLDVTRVRRIDFLSHRRSYQFVEARQLACWFMRHYTGLSSPQIGHLIGGRDHSTVLHAIKRVNSHQDLFNDRVRQIALTLGVTLPQEAQFQ